MVSVIKQPRWSFWRYRQVYQCEPASLGFNAEERVAAFYVAQGAREVLRESGSIHFARGSVLGSCFHPNERFQRQKIVVSCASGATHLTVTCGYRVFNPLPNLHIAPWLLREEVERLETYLETGTLGSKPRPRLPGIHLFFLPLYLLYRFSSWARYWTLRRFTRAGLAVLGAFLIAGTMGLDTENSVAYQAFTLLLALLLVAFVPTFAFRAKFGFTRSLPRFGTAGRPFTYRVAVRNLTRRRQRGLTLLENLADPRPSFAEWRALQRDEQRHARPFRLVQQQRRTHPFRLAAVKEAEVPPMAPNQEVETRPELVPLRRGVLRFAGVTLARSDPLGLFRAFVKMPAPQSVLVLPKRYLIPPIALPGAMKYQQGGVALAANVGQSEEFVSLRDYRRGDPLRHIHWRSWAKAGRPIVKEFEDEFFVRHALVLDTFTNRPQSDEFEEAVSVAASFACTVVTQESLLDLLFVGPEAYCFTAGRGLAHADQMLEILASVKPCIEQPFGSLEHLVLNHASAVSGCLCVLLGWDEARQEFVRKLKALGLPVRVFVVRPTDTAEEQLDPGPMRDEPDRLHALNVGRVEEQLARLT